MKTANTQPTAVEAYLIAKAEIEAKLARLQALAADHFGDNPDAINWGHVGSLNTINARLREVSDFAFQEGECAG